MKRYWIIPVGVLMLVGAFAAVQAQQDPSTEQRSWRASELLGDGWWQSIAIDGQNNVHVSWYGSIVRDNTGFDLMQYWTQYTDGDATGVRNVLFTGSGGYTVRNALTTTTDGLIHVAFRQQTALYYSNAPVYGSENAQNWSRPAQLAETGYYLDLLADDEGILHFVFSGQVAEWAAETSLNAEAGICSFCGNLFYRRSTDGGMTWQPAVPLSIDPGTGSDRPQVFQSSSGRIYIAWDEGLDWYVGRGQPQDVRFVYSDNRGETWSQPVVLSGDNNANRQPIQIGLTEVRNGDILAVWRYSDDTDRFIYYQLSSDDGATWSDSQPVPGIIARRMNDTPLDHYILETDRLGFVHFFGVGLPNETSTANPSLYHVVYQPATDLWLAPQRIYYSRDKRPEWPQVEVGNSNELHLTWFTRGLRENYPGKQSSTDELEVWYSYLTGNLRPEPTIAFRPTQTLLPTATVFQELEPTTTPFPTREQADANIIPFTRDNYAGQTVLGGMMAALVFCSGIVAFIRLRNR
jgi:hypothetical protein